MTPPAYAKRRSPLNPASSSNLPQGPLPPRPPKSKIRPKVRQLSSQDSRSVSTVSGGSLSTTKTLGSMVLYRRADLYDYSTPLLPILPPMRSTPVYSPSMDSFFSLAPDSKYPLGTFVAQRGLVAYAYDPSIDELAPSDEQDLIHDPEGKVEHSSVSWRGIANMAALVFLAGGLVALFVVYPVVSFYHVNRRNAAIIENMIINSTGQAVEFNTTTLDSREGQMPMSTYIGAN
ncbi:hypothetical protein AX17_002171 [Amanita inopinata Kibby_2008]|nr:hypothetical protein AX17_002171 [Amanita inopinata Kibby_2008]